MSTFTALNIDYDKNIAEPDVDDTKELQIEDALKLYQTALKYHIEGPRSFDKAAEAYKELFESEIFKYIESQSEFRREEVDGAIEGLEDFSQILVDVDPVQLVTSGESAPNTLPQILHLSYKSYGQFLLDQLPHSLDRITSRAKEPLNNFAEALDKDDTDLELWRNAATVASIVGSVRIARYCLESMLDTEEEGMETALGIPAIEELYAKEKLEVLVKAVQDDLAGYLVPLSDVGRKRLSEKLMKRLDGPFHVIQPSYETIAYRKSQPVQPSRHFFAVPTRNWDSVGRAIVSNRMQEVEGTVYNGPNFAVGFTLPEPEDTEIENAPEVESPKHISDSSNVVEDVPSVPEEVPALGPGSDAAVASVASADDQDVKLEEAEAQTETSHADQATPEAKDDVPNTAEKGRKRSTDSAGFPDTVEGVRLRSKRIRARETLDGPSEPVVSTSNKDQLETHIQSDGWLFETVEQLFSKINVEGLGPVQTLEDLEDSNDSTATSVQDPMAPAKKDLYEASKISSLLMLRLLTDGAEGDNIDDLGSASRKNGLHAVLGHANAGASRACKKPVVGPSEGLANWVEAINTKWTSENEAAWEFLLVFLKCSTFPSGLGASSSSYMMHRWPEALKTVIVQLAVGFDEFVYQEASNLITEISDKVLKHETLGLGCLLDEDELVVIEMVENFFELHLDVYSRIKHPESGVDLEKRTAQKHTLDRWSLLANTGLNLRGVTEQLDELALRHLWSTVFHLSVSDDVSQSQIIDCMSQMKGTLLSLGDPCIELQNNAVIPEISVAAVNQELNKISMRDFFVKLFSNEKEDPATAIENLEPLLELALSHSTGQNSGQDENASTSVSRGQVLPLEEMSSFLGKTDLILRLSLLQRLRQAYAGIDYPPGVILSYFRSIRLLVDELTSPSYLDLPSEKRRLLIFRWLHLANAFVDKVLVLVNETTEPYEYLGADDLAATMTSLVRLVRLLHSINLYNDSIRAELVPAPSMDGRRNMTFDVIWTKLNNLQLRVWILLYSLFNEAIEQHSEAFPTPAECRLELLRSLHNALGYRRVCAAAGKELLLLMKEEFLKLSDLETAHDELGQVLFDLYGLRCSPASVEPIDHGCMNTENLSRRPALQLLGFVMSQARKVPAKELSKTELKTTIESVHTALGRKGSADSAHNRKIYNQYINANVDQRQIYDALRGTLELPTKELSPEKAPVSAQGWSFLMGSIALSKFRSVKRISPGPIEDLISAVGYFMQDLEYSTENWETWYRTAQTYDLQLEELVSWSAEKLNLQTHEVLYYQRAAIHCYTMAVSRAVKYGEPSSEVTAKVAEMYADFGTRLYSCSREPFGMQAFQFRPNEDRFYSGDTMYKGAPFPSMRLYSVWKVAAALYRRSLNRSPNNWFTHYMLGKCLWKMYTADDDTRSREEPPNLEELLSPFIRAIETLPRRDSRKEPILEPHYKLVSIIHKLVQRRDLVPEAASKILETTPYSRDVGSSSDIDSWEPYVLSLLKVLRSADKSNWHHRMTARAAHVIYDESATDLLAAVAAKSELSMFTKTMSLQVWKPEHERPGRHFVYTSRYLRFYVRILAQIDDRVSMEMLIKRLRRKQHEFFDHARLWHETCVTYLKLLRRAGKVPDGHEETVFKSMHYDDFTIRSDRLEAWCHRPDNTNPTLDILRDVIDLKKTNNGLMKPTLIDDLVCDTYAKLYDQIVPMLSPPTPDPATLAASRPMSLTNVMNPDAPAEPAQRAPRKGVGRRELQRRAEAAVTKPVGPSAVPVPAPRAEPLKDVTVQVVIHSPAVGRVSAGVTPGVSAPGSVHDSADDESELSELDEEEMEEVGSGLERGVY
ncbi:hypothetical protein EJ06DRAFT_497229 [Trichodelitschia bisporula]|uniref:Histone transcription regulator 3 homolog n=1 Tax=Trichodelitschia bisporula TaxID=703511 RepID=A0A6G1HRG6_9PEZI|nr:hypothetical protein EJ06DRAFT_497229 [Trichodelitschia bisporula]